MGAFRKATALALEKIKEISIKIDKNNPEQYRELLERCAATSMSSKLIHQQKDLFSKMVVQAVMMLESSLSSASPLLRREFTRGSSLGPSGKQLPWLLRRSRRSQHDWD